MKPAKSSATGSCRSAITRRSPRPSRNSPHDARALWTVEAMAAAMGAERAGRAAAIDIRAFRSTAARSAPGDAFFAIHGDHRDGHEFVAAALAAKAGLAVVAAERRAQFPSDAPLLVVPDVLAALRDLAAAARARTQAKVIGVTGSVGKTGTKEALRLALSKDGETHASVASYNNHWGVPLSLARCPGERALCGVGNGDESRGRDRAAVASGAPACRDHHDDRAGASGILRLADQDRRRQSGDFSRPRAGRRGVINRDIAQFAHLKRRAKDAGVARIVSFGEHRRPTRA